MPQAIGGLGAALNLFIIEQLIIDACDFYNNTANEGGYGAALYAQSIGQAVFTSSSFVANVVRCKCRLALLGTGQLCCQAHFVSCRPQTVPLQAAYTFCKLCRLPYQTAPSWAMWWVRSVHTVPAY